MNGCGRIRRSLSKGWTPLVDAELRDLRFGTIRLDAGESITMETGTREMAFVLVRGDADARISGGIEARLGPRDNPFDALPYGVMVSREEAVTIRARTETLIGAGSARAGSRTRPAVITPAQVGGGWRGIGNWRRQVRFVCWSDNTEGNALLAGETVTPSGNWSTIPPHRHQFETPGEESPYEEVYFFQFSKPQGFGLAWQFDDAGEMDQAFSLKTNDALYMAAGYHPTVCGPGATLYHLTFMAGPHRVSKSRVHDDFRFLLDVNSVENPYATQFAKSPPQDGL
ncbi:MAG: 5-deoxy-glucuronate isomerase [Acidobacteria bacterium]|nr:5-deoxy-glucuronate isomerase [Acidobacteriota bacterium]